MAPCLWFRLRCGLGHATGLCPSELPSCLSGRLCRVSPRPEASATAIDVRGYGRRVRGWGRVRVVPFVTPVHTGSPTSTGPGSAQSLPFEPCSFPALLVVRPGQLRTLPRLDPQVDVIEHLEHFIQVEKVSPLALPRWVPPLYEVVSMPFQHSLGAGHTMRVCNFLYESLGLAVQCLQQCRKVVLM